MYLEIATEVMLFRCFMKIVLIMVTRDKCYLFTHSLKNIYQKIATAVILFRCNARKVFITIRREVLFIHSFVEKYISGDSNSSYVISMLNKKTVYYDQKRKVLLIHSFIDLLKNIYQEIATAVKQFQRYTKKCLLRLEEKSVISSLIRWKIYIRR